MLDEAELQFSIRAFQFLAGFLRRVWLCVIMQNDNFFLFWPTSEATSGRLASYPAGCSTVWSLRWYWEEEAQNRSLLAHPTTLRHLPSGAVNHLSALVLAAGRDHPTGASVYG